MSFQWLTKWMSEIVLLGSTLYFTYQLSFIFYCYGEAGVVFTLSLRAWRHRLNLELLLPSLSSSGEISGNVFTTKVNITRWFSFLGTRWMFEILQPAWKTSTTLSKTTWRHSSWGSRPVTCVTFVYLSGCLFHWSLSSDSQNTDVIIQMFDISSWGVSETGSVWSM